MVSVERVLEYTHIPPEETNSSSVALPPSKDWPQRGEVTLSNVTLYYGPTDDSADGEKPRPVLDKVTVTFKAQEKVSQFLPHLIPPQ